MFRSLKERFTAYFQPPPLSAAAAPSSSAPGAGELPPPHRRRTAAAAGLAVSPRPAKHARRSRASPSRHAATASTTAPPVTPPPPPPGLAALPDNVMCRVFDILSAAPRPGEMSGRALAGAQDAHALASTCCAFYQLFRGHAVRSIVFDYSAVVVVSSTRGGRHEAQLARLCAFAGENVRSLTVGGCYEGGFEELFATIEERCPNLLRVDIADSDYEFEFGEALLSLLKSRMWKSVRLPMGMRSTLTVTPTPSPSEPDSAFLMRFVGMSTVLPVDWRGGIAEGEDGDGGGGDSEMDGEEIGDVEVGGAEVGLDGDGDAGESVGNGDDELAHLAFEDRDRDQGEGEDEDENEGEKEDDDDDDDVDDVDVEPDADADSVEEDAADAMSGDDVSTWDVSSDGMQGHSLVAHDNSHLSALTCIAFPTRLPSCSPDSILHFWRALPNLRVLSLSADLPPELLARLPETCPNLVDLRLNLLARDCDDNSAARHHLNGMYTDLLKAYSGTLESLLLGWFDLDFEFVSQLVSNCVHLNAVELRDCRHVSASLLEVLGHRLIAIRDTPLEPTAIVSLSNFASRLSYCELLMDDVLAFDFTEAAVVWATNIGRHQALRHLVIKGSREDAVIINWEPVLLALKASLMSSPSGLESLRIERVRSLNEDIWRGLLSAVGGSLTTVSAFESAPITALQFIASLSRFCPRVERIRLPRLYYGEEEELYDAISELMALETKVPFVCVSALRNYTDFVFTFLRRGGLEWTVDEHPM